MSLRIQVDDPGTGRGIGFNRPAEPLVSNRSFPAILPVPVRNRIGFTGEKLADLHPEINANRFPEVQAGMIGNAHKVIDPVEIIGAVGIAEAVGNWSRPGNRSVIGEATGVTRIAVERVIGDHAAHHNSRTIDIHSPIAILYPACDIMVSDRSWRGPGDRSAAPGDRASI